MRKSEMSSVQLHERSAVVELLRAAGWTGSLDDQMFEAGRLCDPEARMEYTNALGMDLEVDYIAESRWLMFSASGERDEVLDLGILIGDKLEIVLLRIIPVQDQISPNTYKEFVRDMLDVVPDGVRIATGNGFVRLSDRDGGTRRS